jgi:hypothetical protein
MRMILIDSREEPGNLTRDFAHHVMQPGERRLIRVVRIADEVGARFGSPGQKRFSARECVANCLFEEAFDVEMIADVGNLRRKVVSRYRDEVCELASDERLWAPFDRRACGSENLSPMPQKDFCNTIRSKADIDLVARRGGQLVSFSEMCS